MKPLSDCRVVIVGLGLMGGSLGGALRGRCRSVVGLARRTESTDEAIRRGLIDEGASDPKAALPLADIVVLAAPVRVILKQIADYAPLLPEGCLLLDMGSTKRQIVAEMEGLPRHVQPMGGHPMCGKEVSGITEADPNLYRGCTFILSPLPRTSSSAVDLGRAVVEAVGARPLVLDAERQDHLAATLSHLPYLLACALVQTADAITSNDPAAWEIVAGGFRDTSRVAGSDLTMMTDILRTNRDEVLRAVDVFKMKLDELVRLVEASDDAALAAALGASRTERRRMFA